MKLRKLDVFLYTNQNYFAIAVFEGLTCHANHACQINFWQVNVSKKLLIMYSILGSAQDLSNLRLSNDPDLCATYISCRDYKIHDFVV